MDCGRLFLGFLTHLLITINIHSLKLPEWRHLDLSSVLVESHLGLGLFEGPCDFLGEFRCQRLLLACLAHSVIHIGSHAVLVGLLGVP
jgi:hypothetical protein